MPANPLDLGYNRAKGETGGDPFPATENVAIWTAAVAVAFAMTRDVIADRW